MQESILDLFLRVMMVGLIGQLDDASIFYAISLIIDKELGLSEEKQDVFLDFLQPFCLLYLNFIAMQLLLFFKEGFG